MKYDLVFEGGGAKGMVFVGALEVFEEEGCQFDRLLGTSAGAITATFLAAGYNSQEMRERLSEKENGRPVFAGFLGEPPPFSEEEIKDSAVGALLQRIDLPLVPEFLEEMLDERILEALSTNPRLRHIFSFIERGGWYGAEKFLVWLRQKLDEKHAQLVDEGAIAAGDRPFSEMNLEDYHEATRRELTLIGADTTAERMLVLNHHTAPQCPVVWATRMSMSVPLLWEEVIWQPEWGSYRGRNISGHAVVDGGLLSNFPIELFVSDEKPVTDVMGPNTSDRVLGMLIDESLPVDDAPPAGALATAFEFGELRTVQRLHHLINTATMAHDKAVIEAFQEMVVRLPARGYGTTEFDMSEERQKALLAAGRREMRRYFDQHPPQTRSVVPFDVPGDPAVTEVANERARRILEW